MILNLSKVIFPSRKFYNFWRNFVTFFLNNNIIVSAEIDVLAFKSFYNILWFFSWSWRSLAGYSTLKDTTTICKKWVKSMFLILGNYLSPKELWTNRFSVVGRNAFKLLICEKFNHDSCWWRHQIKLILNQSKTFYIP